MGLTKQSYLMLLIPTILLVQFLSALATSSWIVRHREQAWENERIQFTESIYVEIPFPI